MLGRHAIAMLLLHAALANAAPFVPVDDAAVLERLPIASDASLRELKRLQGELAEDRSNVVRAVNVAQRAIEAARAFGDPRFLGQAQAALRPWWSSGEPPAAVLVLRATVKQSLHDFDGALADLDRLIAADAGNVQALLTRATVLTVLGRYDEAKRDCERLARRTDALVTTTCQAAAESASGDAEGAFRRLEEALRAGAGSPQVRAWAATLAAEIAARRGDAPAATRYFAQALAADPRDAYLKAAYADFLLEQGQVAPVVAMLKEDVRNDALLLRLALAEARLPEHRAAFETHRDDLIARFAAARRRGDVLHLREEARFALEIERNAAKALELARDNWAKQREPADLRILAEAARATDNADAKRIVADWIAKTGYQDVRIGAPGRPRT
ncbi:MAG TPA: hypothetical protein VNG69_04395 [Casimicrobiaceae bacterium]|nr:hypothetical protein [Casimicrobiaceae bacterium]